MKRNIIKYAVYLVTALPIGGVGGGLLSACSPDSFDGADPYGIPTVNGADFQMTVDQETNQMVATYTPAPGTYPIWVVDGTSYSTLQEVGYKNTEAGTHTVGLKLGNRNGISQGTLTKTFTFNETKINYSSEFRKMTGKEWRIANKEVAHLACGPAGTAGTEWWSAKADDKAGTGLYDDRISFTADTRKGGAFTYHAGADGLTYVNTGTSKWGHQDADWDATIGDQTSTWSFEVYDWTDAEGNVSKQTYIQLAANTVFPYISSDAQYEDPKFRIETLTAKKLVLVYEAPDRSIAWRFIFTSEEAEKEWAGFDADSQFNLWKSVNYSMFFWYAPGWAQIADPEFVANGNDYTVTLPEATTDQWQAQMAFKTTNISTSAAINYDFSCIINSDKDLNGATVKLVMDGDDNVFYFTDRIDLKAGEDYIFWKSDMPGIDMERVNLFFDFGGCQAATVINISSIVLKNHADDDGTVPPHGDDPDTPTVKWVDVNAADNLGADFNRIGSMEFWWADGSWSQIGNPQFSFANGVYTIVATENGGNEWQGQCSIHNATVNLEAGQLYDVRAKIEASDNLGRFTFKICEESDDDNVLVYNGSLTLEAGENYVEFVGVKAQQHGEDKAMTTAKLFVDLGGAPVGFEFAMSDIIIQKHAEGSEGDGGNSLNYDDANNLWKAVDNGEAFVSITPWFANGSWAQIADPEWSHKGNVWSVTLPAEMGGLQWQGQFPINTTIATKQSDKYSFSCTLTADNDCEGITIKLVESDDADGTKHDSNFYFAERHDVKADEPYVYTVTGVSLPLNDAHALSLFFDFGGSPVGTVVEISNITLIKE
ncbi:MAG: hypothetical protein ACSW8D_01150 [Prevotella sp.]